jgi:hypothetical protein
MENRTFESIDSAKRRIELMIGDVMISRAELDSDIAEAARDNAMRRRDALLVVAHQLTLHSAHLTNSSSILNDLRSLRRLLLAEPEVPIKPAQP